MTELIPNVGDDAKAGDGTVLDDAAVEAARDEIENGEDGSAAASQAYEDAEAAALNDADPEAVEAHEAAHAASEDDS